MIPIILDGDVTRNLQIVHVQNLNQAGVEIVQKLFPKRSTDLKRQDGMYVSTVQNIDKKEKLFFDCTISYNIGSATQDCPV